MFSNELVLCLNEDYVIEKVICNDNVIICKNSDLYPLLVRINYEYEWSESWRDHYVNPIGYDLCQFVRSQYPILHKNSYFPEHLRILSFKGEVRNILGKECAFMSDLIKPVPTGVSAKDIFKELKNKED